MGSFNKRCVVLYSGGLDSLLAVYIMHDMGFEVLPLFVKTPFYRKDVEELRKRLEPLKLQLRIEYDIKGYMEMLTSPEFGYGKSFNPCVDCKVFFYRKAKEVMEEVGATFVVAGDVLGQRPFSQRSYSVLRAIEKRASLEDRVLRPLSAKCLPETAMEKEGIVDREKLFCITGRGRKEQFALAERFGIDEFESPAGGCLLTDRVIGLRVREMLKHGFSEVEIEIIDKGRHFRIGGKRFVVSRNRSETRFFVDSFLGKLPLIRCVDAPGAAGVFLKHPDEYDKSIGAAIVLRYSKKATKVGYFYEDESQIIKPADLSDEQMKGLRIADGGSV